MHFKEPCQKFFAIRRLLSLRFRKRSNNYSLVFSPEKTLKSSAAPSHRLQFYEIWQKNHAKSPIISPNDQKTWADFLHSEETFENCSVEHRESGFDNAASNFCLIVQTFCSKSESELKNIFSTIFFPQFFSVILGCFFDTLTFFVNSLKNCSNSKTDEQ